MSKIKILVVDDDKDDFEILRDLIADVRTSAYSLEWVNQYEEGLKRAIDNTYDIYLFDYRLGPRTGLELLRESIQKGCRAPIVLLTGYGDEEIDKTAMLEGAADYLLKGEINSHLIERTIRYAIYRSQALEALKEEQQNIRSLLDSIFEGVFITSLDGTIVLLNLVAARIFHRQINEMLGVNISEFLDIAALSEKNATRCSDIEAETTGTRADGTKINVEVSQKPYFFEGKLAKLIAVHDVSHKRELEAQIVYQDRLASVGLLASGLAHEIGTPLGVIRGRAEFLAELEAKNEVVTKNASVIVSQIDRVSSLIRSLLNLARGDTIRNLEKIDVSAVAADVISLMAHEFTRAEIEVINELTPLIEMSTHGRAESLHQVFLNLFVNSVHAIQTAKERGRTASHFIKLSAQRQNGFWAISIEDSGCGISKENMKNLFKPFFTTKEVGTGTGLGLLNSYRIISSWGGSMTVDSKENIGTTVRVLLPAAHLHS